MKVFLGGSRKLDFVPDSIQELLKLYMNLEAEFLIGDAVGVDTKFQLLLSQFDYKNVTIFSSANYIRSNLGNWPSLHIDSGYKTNNAKKHSYKDRFMSTQTDVGIMIWDKTTIGTLANVIDLISLEKKCFLYVAGNPETFEIQNSNQLNSILNEYSNALQEARKRLQQYSEREKRRNANLHSGSLFD